MKSVAKAIRSGLILAASLFVTSAGSAFAQDWSLNITDAGYDPIPAGGDVVYQVRVDNALSSLAPATTVVFEIPANSTYQRVTGALTNCVATPGPTGPATVTCDMPALAGHQTIDAQLTLIPNTAGSIEIAGNLGGDRVVQRTTVVEGADLSFEFLAPASARGGELYTFTARIRNNGPNTSNASTATISLPPGMSAPLSMPAGCTISGRDITCNLAAIAANNVLNLEFTTQITADSVSTLALAGSVAGNTPRDPRLGNNGGSAGLNVVPGTDVQIGKVRTANNPVMIGDTVTFTLTPRYVGLPPTDAVITDVVPPNYRVDSVASGSGWTCSTAQTVSCIYAGTAGDAASYTQPVVITATALTPTQDLDDPPAFVTNEAVITSSTDNVTTNNSGTDGGASIVEPYVDLRAIKNAPPLALGVVGQTYPWEIGTINLGNAPFYGPLEFVDRVPAGLRVESITEPAGWTCDAATPVTGPVTITCSTNQPTFPKWPAA